MNAMYMNGLLGGMLIGLAALILFWFNGRIMGVSGIMSRLLSERGKDNLWRLAFVLGLVVGGVIISRWFHVQVEVNAQWPVLIIAGLLVGYGTVKANGCTSGHGICGMARLSKRSIVATLCFMTAGIITVFICKRMGL